MQQDAVIAFGSAKKAPRGCPHCGNSKNEAEYCSICGKNQEGNLINKIAQ